MRKAILRDLSQLTAENKKQYSENIQNKLTKELKNRNGVWAAFMPLNSEPQLEWSAISQNIQWCFPIITNELNEKLNEKLNENQLSFIKGATSFEKNNLGFMQPKNGEIINTSTIQGFIVPGLAFDVHGNRLGRGQGYYDQTLKNYKGFIFGVCFHTALKDQVPTEDHDLRCHLILTENQSVVIEGVSTWN